MERKWSITAYEEGDEEGIFELWKEVYPEREYDHEKWLSWWKWMYKENPAGAGLIWLAKHDTKIVGQYAMIPMSMKIGSEAFPASLSLDTMTHPDYRRQKMFETLADKVYHEAQKNGTFIVYGFPNQFSYPGFIKKLNWFDVAMVQTMFKPLNWPIAAKLKVNNKFLQQVFAAGASLVFNKALFTTRKPPIVKGLTIGQVNRLDDRVNDFCVKVSSQHQIMVVRSKDYLNWRYSPPDVNYSIFVAEKASEMLGYLILRQNKQREVKVGSIFDMLAESPEVIHCLLSKVIEHCQQNKIDVITYSLIANKTYYGVLRRNGFLSLPFSKGARLCAYSSSPSISKEFLRNRENWFVQTGDSDAL